MLRADSRERFLERPGIEFLERESEEGINPPAERSEGVIEGLSRPVHPGGVRHPQ